MHLSPLLGKTQSGDQFVIAEWTAGPCPAEGPMWEAPLHRHHHCDEAWYVLEGRLSFLVDGEELTAIAGDLVQVNKGSAHTYWNPDATTARYLLVMTPATQELINAIHAGSDRSEAGLKAIFADHGAEFLGWKV